MNAGAQVKKLFFDSKPVMSAMDAKDRKALSRIGAFIRQRARSSMRRRKAVSQRGQPPSAHEGSLKEKLYFSFDPAKRSVVVGPVKYKKGIANVLEEGGESRIVRKGV